MRRYPRSFIHLIAYGYTLVVLPFLFVTGYTFLTLQTLDGRYQVAIRDFSENTRLTLKVAEDLTDMERSLRRYEILKNEDSLNDYAQTRSQWRTDIASFARLSAIPEHIGQDLQAMILAENAAYARLAGAQDASALRVAIDDIKIRLQKVRDEVRERLVQEQATFKKEADVLRQRLVLAIGVAILTAVGFIGAGWRYISRLIGSFEKAVLRLGQGDLQNPIDLRGPSDMRWLGRWLEWLRRRLQTLEETRIQGLRHVSHELKTPLSAIREGTNLLEEEVAGPLTQEQTKIVQILQGNSRRLQNLIEGLLRLQQAEHAAERIGFERLRLDQLIEQVVDTYRLIAAEQHVLFDVKLSPTEVVAGREELMTIINNLLSNAVKFSPDGGTIIVQLTRRDDQIQLDVIDNGPGIAGADRVHIFEPFYRSSTSRPIAGVGLGLAIAREFVLAHQGELRLLDSPRGGAHFRVTLPQNAPFARTQRTP